MKKLICTIAVPVLALCLLLLSTGFPRILMTSEGDPCVEGLVPDCLGVCGGSAVFDECGVCDGSGKTGYTTAQAGTAYCCPPGTPEYQGLPDDCGVCGGSNTDKDECGNCYGTGKELFTPAQSSPVSCCPQDAPDACGVCGGHGADLDDCGVCNGNNAAKDICGVCYGDGTNCCPNWAVRNIRYAGSAGVSFTPTAGLAPACAIPLIQSYKAQCGSNESCWQNAFQGNLNGSGTGFVFFNSSCQIIGGQNGNNQSFVDSQCIVANIRHDSPISLLLGKESKLDEEVVFAKFPLNPAAKDQWYEWRASDNAPLLVFDPEHTGKITTASQLFGNWTFGGQKVASLSSGQTATPWENGYDALSTLDLDGNGKVDGTELAPLGLWFDSNRDAISQPGEVRPVSAEGITALYYAVSHTNARSGNVYADLGFERLVDGESVTGRSVDWYAKGSDSRNLLRAAINLQQVDDFSEIESLIEAVQEKAPELQELSNRHAPVLGLYKWQEEKGGEAAAQGLLYLYENEKGLLKGYSFVEIGVTPEMKVESGVASVLIANLLSGTVSRTEDSYSLTFQIETSNTTTETSIAMPFDRVTLNGKSVMGTKKIGEEKEKYTYSWKGELIE